MIRKTWVIIPKNVLKNTLIKNNCDKDESNL